MRRRVRIVDFHLHIPEDLHGALLASAERDNRSLGRQIETLLREALERREAERRPEP